MCTITFSIELQIFRIDDKDITTTNICEKSGQIINMDDASVHHPPVYVKFFGWLTGASSARQNVK